MSELCVRACGGEDPNAGLEKTELQLNYSFIAGDEQNMNWTMNAENGNTQAQSESTTGRWTLQDKYTGRNTRERGTGGNIPEKLDLTRQRMQN